MRNNKINSFIDHLYALDYRERPVSMETFLTNTEFLGGVTDKGRFVYDYWRQSLNAMATEDTKYIRVHTGSTSTGKTRSALWDICYGMHRVLCLKDPWSFFAKTGGGKFAVVLFNLTKSLSASRGYGLLQSYLCSSPWFAGHGRVYGLEGGRKIEIPIFDLKVCSPLAQGFGIIGEDVLFALMDEVDDPSVGKAVKLKIIEAYNEAVIRLKERFVRDNESIGRFYLVSSKQEKLAFLNTYIKQFGDDPAVYIKDDPAWRILPKSNYSGRMFNLSLGNIYSPPKVLNSAIEESEAKKNGFEILPIPSEYINDFKRDPVGSLRRIAGIAVSHLRSNKLFASERIILDCFDRFDDGPDKGKFKPAPVELTEIPIGLKDDINLAKFINFEHIITSKSVPRFIHIDIAFSGDALGIGMSHISGWTNVPMTQLNGTVIINKKPVARTDFAMRIKARHGDQIPMHKIHELILSLRDIYGFKIEMVTYDLKLASTTSMQTLTLANFQCGDLSMDKDPSMYRGFRDLVNEGRWECRYDHFLHFELANLDDDPEKNKIDHPDKVEEIVLLPEGGTKEIVVDGSKDKSDGVAGSVMKALEKCSAPPDIEIMKRMMDHLSKPTMIIPTIDSMPKEAAGLLDSRNQKKEKPLEKPKNQLNQTMEIYKQIIDKCK